MQPVYVNSCIDSVEKAVTEKIDAMKVVADRCKACTKCKSQGFQNPDFVNNSCPIPTNVGGILTKIFSQVSSILGSLENAWKTYREDAIQNLNYMSTKILDLNNNVWNTNDWLSSTYDYLNFNWNKLDVFRGVVYKYYLNLGASFDNFNAALKNFNNYFMNATDTLIIYSNKQLEGIITKNWNNVNCRDGVLGEFFVYGYSFVSFWDYYMSSLFYVVDIDGALSHAFVQASNFTDVLGACVDGVQENSNDSVKTRAISCLNQVI